MMESQIDEKENKEKGDKNNCDIFSISTRCDIGTLSAGSLF